jgi:hypothetical protein
MIFFLSDNDKLFYTIVSNLSKMLTYLQLFISKPFRYHGEPESLAVDRFYKVCFFKFGVEVGVEELIVNEPLVLKTLIFQTAY